MGPIRSKSEGILLGMFAVTLAFYLMIFATAFSELPLQISHGHQLLLLTFHFFPMFLLQLLLCLRAKWYMKLLLPLALLAIPGFIFLQIADWAAMGWVFYLIWCIAPVSGATLAWGVWGILQIIKKCRNDQKKSRIF